MMSDKLKTHAGLIMILISIFDCSLWVTSSTISRGRTSRLAAAIEAPARPNKVDGVRRAYVT